MMLTKALMPESWQAAAPSPTSPANIADHQRIGSPINADAVAITHTIQGQSRPLCIRGRLYAPA